MDTKKVRQGARGVRKVKTGCQTCKTRRKKCDEAKPACSQCRTAGWRCDFNTSGGLGSTALSRVEYSQPSVGLQVSLPAAASMAGTSELDMHLLEYFKQVTWKDFALFFNDLTWESKLLQVIGTEPIIYHVGLAISALGRNKPSDANLWTEGGRVRSAIEYSTTQYNMAIQVYKSRMDKPLEYGEVLVLGSLMFIHLEFVRGVTDFVLVHLQGANALLNSLKRVSRDTRFLEAAVEYVEAQWREHGRK